MQEVFKRKASKPERGRRRRQGLQDKLRAVELPEQKGDADPASHSLVEHREPSSLTSNDPPETQESPASKILAGMFFERSELRLTS